MSAALTPNEWEMVEHEPTIADEAAGHARMAADHGGTAAQARDAQMAHESSRTLHAGAAQQMFDMMTQIHELKQQTSQIAAQAAEDREAAMAAAEHAATCAQAASDQASQAHMLLNVNQQLVEALRQIAETFAAPRRMSVARGDDGAITEITTEPERSIN